MSNRLPETELANWSFLPAAQKHVSIEAFMRPKQIKGSYEPFRRVFPDAVNQQFPLFGDRLQESRWSAIESRLVQACKGDEDKITMNKAILASTYAYAQANSIVASGLDVVPLRFPGGVSYSFGLGVLVRYPGRAAVVFLDMRKSNNLNANGLNFVFSALHHRFREAYPDLAEVDREVWRYRTGRERALIALNSSHPIIEWDALAADVAETHEIWERLKKGGDGVRRTGTGHGPLFD